MKRFLFKNFAYPLVRMYWRVFQPVTIGARGIVVNGGDVLLVRHIGKNYWSLPGGEIGSGEDPVRGLSRELWEELRIPVNVLTLDYKLGMYTSDGEGKHDTLTIFVVQMSTRDFVVRYELDDAQWFSLKNLPQDLSPATKRRIDEYLSGERGIDRVW